MVHYSIKCPHCNEVVESGHDRQTQYGSPFRKCRFCGHGYVDTNYIEAGMYDDIDINKKSFKWVFGTALYIMVGAYFLYYGLSSLKVSALLIGVFSLALGILSTISNIRYHPEQDAKLQKEIQESKQRLSDPRYVIALWKAECHVTPELLKWAKKAIAEDEEAKKDDNA